MVIVGLDEDDSSFVSYLSNLDGLGLNIIGMYKLFEYEVMLT